MLVREHIITGIILAGGKSSRMGQDKGLLPFGNKKMVQKVYDELRKYADRVIVIANNSQYKALNFEVYPDIIENFGPVGGIYTGLYHSNTPWNMVIACDMPFIDDDLLSKFLRSDYISGNYNCVALKKSNTIIQPIPCMIHQSSISQIKKLMRCNSLSLTKVIENLKTQFITISDHQKITKSLFNINSPVDYSKLVNVCK